jgi:probable rRNA maturation factor
MPLAFFTEGIQFQYKGKRKASRWIDAVVRHEGARSGSINVIFCSDNFLLGLNKKYLNHDFLTDVITFSNSEIDGFLEGEIYISVPRVIDNAKNLEIRPKDEFDRVILHGILHLLGYNDKKRPQRSLMRKKEDAYLSLRPVYGRST